MNELGYPQVGWQSKTRYAHRIVYELLRGPIPEDKESDHLCRVRHCVNPDHLEMVSHRENTLRGDTLPALNARKTHCKRGHPFDEENTYAPPGGGRVCRACSRDYMKLWREKNRA